MTNDGSLLHRLFSLAAVVLVTGAAGGIGRVLAVAMAEAGADVGLHNLDLARLEESRRAIEGVGRVAVPLAAQLNDPEQCQLLIEQTYAELGRVDVC